MEGVCCLTKLPGLLGESVGCPALEWPWVATPFFAPAYECGSFSFALVAPGGAYRPPPAPTDPGPNGPGTKRGAAR
jgi:hypothetical protein